MLGRLTRKPPRVVLSILDQLLFAVVSLALTFHAIAFMEVEAARAFIVAFAFAQSYVPVQNSLINLTMGSRAPRLKGERRRRYGAFALRFALVIAFLHGGLVLGLVAWSFSDIGLTLWQGAAIMSFSLLTGVVNFMRYWQFQALHFDRAALIDLTIATVVVIGIVGLQFSEQAARDWAAPFWVAVAARALALVAFHRWAPQGAAPPRRLARAFLGRHLSVGRWTALFAGGNYLRVNGVYILLDGVLGALGLVLLKAADLFLMPVRQISYGVVTYLVPNIARGGVERGAIVRIFAAALAAGAAAGGALWLISLTPLPTFLPERFETALLAAAPLIALMMVAHFASAAAVAVLRGRSQFPRLGGALASAAGVGIALLVLAISYFGDWRLGVAGFIAIDLIFVMLAAPWRAPTGPAKAPLYRAGDGGTLSP